MNYDCIVIGAGPAGLSAALSARQEGASVLLIEREAMLGGILKQCIHDGFGLIRFGKRLTGPEYAEWYIRQVLDSNVQVNTLTYVTQISKKDGQFAVTVINRQGVCTYFGKALVLANGCRERTARQVGIHGSRPSGVFTAGTAQYLVNILGQLPTKNCVILGSGDIGLIMARRLTLEGAKVSGVYEAKSTPSGLLRNIRQCLEDFSIPLYLSKTVTRLFGHDRLEKVEICDVDEQMVPIKGTEQYVECDALILSVGLIPENELAKTLNIPLDKRTNGAYVDERLMSEMDGVFCCGNCLCVSDLVDYVSESGERAGKYAAHYTPSVTTQIKVNTDENFALIVPQRLSHLATGKCVFYFRVKQALDKALLTVICDGQEIYQQELTYAEPNTMERVEVSFPQLTGASNVLFKLSIKGDKSE